MEEIVKLNLEDRIQPLFVDVYEPKTDSVVSKSIEDFAGKWLVLFFYPADFTFVCPTELKDLNKAYEDIKDANAEVLVVSTDTVFSHKRWVETEKLLEKFGIQMASDRK
jgi:peroxiredoxin (alkyl hydroperoxide reductase subunit C)